MPGLTFSHRALGVAAIFLRPAVVIDEERLTTDNEAMHEGCGSILGGRRKFRFPLRIRIGGGFFSLGRPPVQFLKPLQQLAAPRWASIAMFAVRPMDSQASQHVTDSTSEVHNPPAARSDLGHRAIDYRSASQCSAACTNQTISNIFTAWESRPALDSSSRSRSHSHRQRS